MLFQIGFPGVGFYNDYDEQVATSESDGSAKRQSVEGSSTVSSKIDRTMNVSTKTYRVYGRTSLQGMMAIIRFDFESWRVTLQRKNEGESSQFVRHDWVDTAMGIMKGLGEGKMKMIEG